MEFCPGGDLFKFLMKAEGMHPLFARQLIEQICMGLVELKKKALIHRDLKTANIMMRTNQDPAIIDFGYCEMIMGKRPMIQYNVGSPSYMAP